MHRAVGNRLTCIFVNNGLLRRQEAERVQAAFQRGMGLNLGICRTHPPVSSNGWPGSPTRKPSARSSARNSSASLRKPPRAWAKSGSWPKAPLYPDVIESEAPPGAGPGGRLSARIKTHHNVGGLPENMRLQLVEPLRYLFKDEVREVGLELGLPPDIVHRQPFPGPGLAIRIIGEVTQEKLDLLRACDWIVIDEIKAADLYDRVWQSFAVLSDSRTVGVQGDYRTYGYVCALRCVTSQDAMTADWARLPYETLARISNRIVNEVPGVNRVVYDITSKPPGTIEWE